MPVLADGALLDPGPVSIMVHRRALNVMAGTIDASMGELPQAQPGIIKEVAVDG